LANLPGHFRLSELFEKTFRKLSGLSKDLQAPNDYLCTRATATEISQRKQH
jgi:hypothetical protein